jgi:hypothetical protein
VKVGDSRQDVHERLGEPFGDVLVYPDLPEVCVAVGFERDTVIWARPPDECRARGIRALVPRSAVMEALGTPVEECWLYSRSPGGRFYRARFVCFGNDRVIAVIRSWRRD